MDAATAPNRAQRRKADAIARSPKTAERQERRPNDAPTSPAAEPFSSIKLIRPPELCQALGIQRWTLDRWIARGIIPPPIRISEKTFVWRLADVEAALIKCARSRKKRKPRGALMQGRELVEQR